MLASIVGLSGPARSAAPIAVCPPPAARPAVDDRGTFTLSLAGRPVGTEKFDIRASKGKIEARAEIELRFEQDGKTVALRASSILVMTSEFQPITYDWSQKGAPSSELTVDFRASPARSHYRAATGQEDNRDFTLPKDVVVLDSNVVHHFQLVVDRLPPPGSGPPGAGPQAFKAFVPQEALPGDLKVEEVPDASKLRHLRLSTELTHIDLWVNEGGRLERVSNPEAQFEAVRER